MKCLRCRDQEMRKLVNGETEVDVCFDSCGGIWFDPMELKKMNERSEIDQPFLQQLFQAELKKVDTSPRLECPKCNVKMLRHFHSVRREVEIDQCPMCYGHWLDGGELLKIINQFRNKEERIKETQAFFQKLKSK